MIPEHDVYNRAKEAADHVVSKSSVRPEVAIILGSGLSGFADTMGDMSTIAYEEIPYFPSVSAVGHVGEMITGTLNGAPIAAMKGRVHVYEGYTMRSVTFPVRVFQLMGIQTLIVTNAAGGINQGFEQGDLMAIVDHINMMGDNPLIGSNEDELGPRFPDMTEAYSRRLIALADEVAAEQKTTLRHGVYVGVAGPSFETPAEIEFLRRGGADAVGMSTVPEVIVAQHAGMEVLGISCITNVIGESPVVTAEEVLEVADRSGAKLQALLGGVIRKP